MPAPPSPPIRLVFFDIDGTLLHIAGAGRRAFARTLRRVFGWRDAMEHIQFAGATDLQVVEQIMAENGHPPTSAELDRFFEVLPEEFALTLAGADAVLFPGVKPLLERLSADDRFLLGLVTGNIEPCARQKLAHFDLHGHFLLGAFGHEHADRNEIARLALRRARAFLDPARTLGPRFLVGDTPSDVAAAHAIGGLAIAVATGAYGIRELIAAGADAVVEDLADTEAIVRLLG